MIVEVKKVISIFCLILNKFIVLRTVLLLFFLLFTVHTVSGQVEEQVRLIAHNMEESTIRNRFIPPKGYEWQNEKVGTFAEFLVHQNLLPTDFPLRDYTNQPMSNQNFHAAILSMDVGNQDLQQCADAWIRLYAEYLWKEKRYDEIQFQFTSGQSMSWNDFKKGMRTQEDGERVRFFQKAKYDDSYQNFRRYLNLVFQYAGTISLDRESRLVKNNADIRVGDLLITPGSPGHCVFIVGISKNKNGKKLYLLAESFMPAQDIHIIKNPRSRNSPWYELDVHAPVTYTAKYHFKPTAIKRFYQLED